MGLKKRLSLKEFSELTYWRLIKLFKKTFSNAHYKYFYTDYFSLRDDFYKDKTILDIGCGPRGSLEWASMCRERIGIDPLADKYGDLRKEKHEMSYVKGYVENIPFPNDYFDVISSFNSLDHVENIKAACNEIKRCLKTGGIFLLIVDIHNLPTLTEPQTIQWSFIMDNFLDFEIVSEVRLECVHRNKIYRNLRINRKIEGEEKSRGVLTAKLKKR